MKYVYGLLLAFAIIPAVFSAEGKEEEGKTGRRGLLSVRSLSPVPDEGKASVPGTPDRSLSEKTRHELLELAISKLSDLEKILRRINGAFMPKFWEESHDSASGEELANWRFSGHLLGAMQARGLKATAKLVTEIARCVDQHNMIIGRNPDAEDTTHTATGIRGAASRSDAGSPEGGFGDEEASHEYDEGAMPTEAEEPKTAEPFHNRVVRIVALLKTFHDALMEDKNTQEPEIPRLSEVNPETIGE